jgi:two-component system chemotaxis response regulator CheY
MGIAARGGRGDGDAIHFTYSGRPCPYDAFQNADPPFEFAMNPNTRFLVVDDFAPMREIIRKVLQEMGYEPFNIQEANDGATALPLLQMGSFDMLITDWNMPKLPGIGLLRAVRAEPRLAKLPVLMVTAEVKREQIIAATQAGVNGYIIKPFTAAALAAKVEKILNN